MIKLKNLKLIRKKPNLLLNDKIEKFKPTVKLKAVFKSNQLKNSITVVKESNAKDKKNTNAFYQKNSNKKVIFHKILKNWLVKMMRVCIKII